MPDKIKFSSLNAYKEFENAHNDVIKNLGELLIHDISRFKKLLLKQSEKSLDKWLSIKLLTELKETSRLAHQSCRDGFQTSPPSAAVIETLYLTSEYNQKVAKLLNEANKLLNEAKYIEDKKEYGELFPPLPVEEDDKRFLDAYKKIPNKDRPEILDTLLKEEGEYSIQEEKGRMVDLVDWIDSQAWWRNNETPNYAELFHLVTDPTLEIKMPPEKIDKDFLKVYHNIPEKYRENVKDAIKKLKDSNEKATLKQKITAYFSDGKNETLCSEKYCQHFGVTEWLLKQETSLENVNKTLKQDKYIYSPA